MDNYINCMNCATKLKYSDKHLGKTIRCPSCKEPIEIPSPVSYKPKAPAKFEDEFEGEEDTFSRFEEKARKLKKSSKKKSAFLEFISQPNFLIFLFGLFVLLSLGFIFWFFVSRLPPAKLHPEEKWETFEQQGKYKVLVPGKMEMSSLNVAGISLSLANLSIETNDHNQIYTIGVSSEIPPHRLSIPVEELLHDTCEGMTQSLWRMNAYEKSRSNVKYEQFPGKQVIYSVSEKKGSLVARCYIANKKLYIVMVGGTGLNLRHPDVVKYFKSFEILNQAQDDIKPENPAVAANAGQPAGPAEPAKQEFENKKSTFPIPKSKFNVDPAITKAITDQQEQIYLTDMSEFNLGISPPEWRFGKAGTLGTPIPGQKIAVNQKLFPKGLGTHPIRGHYTFAYALDGQCTTLKGMVGIGDPGNSQVGHFLIVGDGELIWQSKNKTGLGKTEEFEVDVSNVKILEMRCYAENDHYFGCHCAWLDPVLILKK